MIFHYEGHTKLGQPVVGQVEADSEADAARIIREDKGHYARELNTSPVEAKYEIPAVGGVAPLPEGADIDSVGVTWEAPGLAQTFDTHPGEKETLTVPDVPPSVRDPKPITRPGEPAAGPPCDKPPKREMPVVTARDNVLKDNVEKGAEGLRQLLRWSEVARKGEKHDDMPTMGKKAWELFDSSFRDIAVGVFREAVVRSIFRE